MSLTVRQVAALANVSAKTIHNLGARGLVPGRIKIGRATRFNRGAILRWLEGRPAESREGGDGRG